MLLVLLLWPRRVPIIRASEAHRALHSDVSVLPSHCREEGSRQLSLLLCGVWAVVVRLIGGVVNELSVAFGGFGGVLWWW